MEQLGDRNDAQLLPADHDGHFIVRGVDRDLAVAGFLPAPRLGEHFDGASVHIEDPVLRDRFAGVERQLDAAIEFERRVGHLNQEENIVGTRVAFVVILNGSRRENRIGLRFAVGRRAGPNPRESAG